MKVADIDIKSIENLKNPVWFREWFKIIMRQWAMQLTMQQLAVVLFIFDRTAAWGKEWEHIRFKSFVDGVTSKNGAIRYSAGVCSSVATAMRLTKELVDMKCLRKVRTKLGNKWAINYEYNINNNSMRRKITRSKLASVQGSEVASVQGSIITTKEKKNATQTFRRSASENSELSVEDALQRARSKAQAARDRQELRKKGKMNSVQVAQAWTAALQKADWTSRNDIASGRMYLSKRDAQALKSYSDRFLKNYPDKSFKEFLVWAIVNWQEIRVELFSWMTKAPAPETPMALFIIRWAATLEQRYMQGIAFENKLKSPSTVRIVNKETPSISIKSKANATINKKRSIIASLPAMDNSTYADEYEK